MSWMTHRSRFYSLIRMAIFFTLGLTYLKLDTGRGRLSPGVRQVGRKNGPLPPASAEVMNMWGYNSISLKHLHGTLLN
jgi:hypothetical protein